MADQEEQILAEVSEIRTRILNKIDGEYYLSTYQGDVMEIGKAVIEMYGLLMRIYPFVEYDPQGFPCPPAGV